MVNIFMVEDWCIVNISMVEYWCIVSISMVEYWCIVSISMLNTVHGECIHGGIQMYR